jgi:hypothetical protein
MFIFRFTHFQLGAVLATSFVFAMLPRAGYGYRRRAAGLYR